MHALVIVFNKITILMTHMLHLAQRAFKDTHFDLCNAKIGREP